MTEAINQGDVYWADLGAPVGFSPGYRRPFVVVQNNLFNRSRISTVVVCALTSNLRRAEAPGNVLLDDGEANLLQRSIVNVSQVVTLDKSQLDEKIGTLSAQRVRQVLDGLRLVLEPREVD